MQPWSKYSMSELATFFIINNMSRYLLITGVTYLIFWKWGFPKFQKYFLYKDKPKREDLKREFRFSILSSFIFILPSMFAYAVKDLGWNKIYWDISDKGYIWYFASFIIVFFIHDTYFYWTHRLMHHKLFYKTFHHVHHLSKKPSPLAAFSFHPLEALVESAVFVLISFTVPVHFTVIVIFTLFSLFMNVYGHLGFNMWSEKALNSFPLKLFSHTVHHSWHHQHYRGNYGFYLLFWDKMMGTFKGEYRK